jgi:hypothetical protein
VSAEDRLCRGCGNGRHLAVKLNAVSIHYSRRGSTVRSTGLFRSNFRDVTQVRVRDGRNEASEVS